jgi:hypothetical protein
MGAPFDGMGDDALSYQSPPLSSRFFGIWAAADLLSTQSRKVAKKIKAWR